MTSGTPNLSGRQLKKQEPTRTLSQSSSTAPNTVIQANTPQRSHAESLPSTAQKVPPAGHVSRTSSECRVDDGTSEYSQSSQGSKSRRRKISLHDDWAIKTFANRDSPNPSNVVADPNKAHDTADGLGKDRVSATSTSVEKENQELKTKLEEMTTENQALAKHLRESRDLSKDSNKLKLENEREVSRLWRKLGDQHQRINALISENFSHRDTISNLRDKASQDEEDARQSMMSLQNQVTQFQKLLDDHATQNMSLDATVKDLRKKADGVSKLEASNKELREKNKKLEDKNSQMKHQYNTLKQEKDMMIVQNDQLQFRLKDSEHQLQQKSSEHAVAEDSMKRQVEELQKQVGSQRDEVREYETRVADLREEVDWYEGNRERIKKEWDERLAMEMKWRDDLMAIINNNMPAAQMRRATLAAPDPIQQAAQRDAQRGSAQQQTAPEQTAQQQTAQQQSALRQSAQRQAAKRGASRGGSSSGGGSRASR